MLKPVQKLGVVVENQGRKKAPAKQDRAASELHILLEVMENMDIIK